MSDVYLEDFEDLIDDADIDHTPPLPSMPVSTGRKFKLHKSEALTLVLPGASVVMAFDIVCPLPGITQQSYLLLREKGLSNPAPTETVKTLKEFIEALYAITKSMPFKATAPVTHRLNQPDSIARAAQFSAHIFKKAKMNFRCMNLDDTTFGTHRTALATFLQVCVILNGYEVSASKDAHILLNASKPNCLSLCVLTACLFCDLGILSWMSSNSDRTYISVTLPDGQVMHVDPCKKVFQKHGEERSVESYLSRRVRKYAQDSCSTHAQSCSPNQHLRCVDVL